MALISETHEWTNLQNHFNDVSNLQMKDLFEQDKFRFDKFSLKFNNLLLDYSKNRITEETISLLVDLAKKADLKNWIEKKFNGEKINSTEDRAVLHTALRNKSKNPIITDNIDVMPEIISVKEHMKEFVESIHSGEKMGFTGKRITNIVNIGIGGSDLGPAMVSYALKPYCFKGMKVHFVSNVDGTDIVEKLKELDVETTLFIIASKTFTTQETLTNANTAKKWFLENSKAEKSSISKHFVALSTNREACIEFGIDPENMFAFWNWVGGRYSLWSAIGLSIALYIGMDNFERLLQGAYDMDIHFRETEFERNMPVLLAIIGIWYNNFFGTTSQAIIPYDQYLLRFPEFLQQLDMESNGKIITKSNEKINYQSGPIIWGTIGTNSQHSFFQLIHQGTHLIPVDFLIALENHNQIGEHQDILISNCFAQSEALMKGKNEKEVETELNKLGFNADSIKLLLPHKVFLGNKPTNTIVYKKLTPEVLGSLIALYEHKVFVQGVIWNLNSFDQWGVELGKQLAKKILSDINSPQPKVINHDSSTNGLINLYKSSKQK